MATVQVWVAALDAPAALLAALSPAEHHRAERYRHSGDARRFAAGRGWLRHLLGAELGVPPVDVPLVDGPGKPRLAGGGPHFNLSRSGELAVVAMAPFEVGVDVERHDEGRVMDAAPVACTPAELAGLGRLPADKRADAFLELWTAKEAYVKGRGVGLAVAPDRVELGPVGGDGAVPVRTLGEAGPARWWVRRLRPRPGYVAAVAAEGRAWEIAIREAVTPTAPIRG
jgi:4'-phosphopantetheinyl transferase